MSDSLKNNIIFRSIFLTLALLLLVAVSRALFIKGVSVSFSSFLKWLSTIDSTTITVSITDFLIGGSWGAFDFFRNFINIFAQILGVLVYFGANIINALIFISQFVVYLFAGA